MKKCLKITGFSLLMCLMSGVSKSDAVNIKGVDVVPYAEVMGAYDDNITFKDEDPQGDYISIIRAGVKANHQGKTSRLELEGIFSQYLYGEVDEFDFTQEEFVLKVEKDFSAVDKISISNHFTHSQEPISFDDTFSRDAGRFSFFLNDVDVSYSREISSHLLSILKYGNLLYRAADDAVLDSVEHRGGVQLDYRLDKKTTLISEYEYSYKDFTPGSYIAVHSLDAGIRRAISPKFYVEGRVGADYLREDGDDEERLEPSYLMSLSHEINGTTEATITLEKRFMTSLFVNDILDAWQVSIDLDKQFYRRLNVGLAGFYRNGEYLDVSQRDEFLGMSVQLQYEINSKLSADVTYNYSGFESNDGLSDYIKNYTQLGVRWIF